MHHSLLLWTAYVVFILIMLGIDLWVFNRESHKITIKESLTWTFIWIALSLVFGAGVYIFMGHQQGIDYFTGYLIEKSLSMDNIFVFLLIFKYFGVAPRYQHEVLFYGILGALVMRFLFIIAGVALLNHFAWTIYVFGAFLVYTGIKMAFEKDKEVHPEKNPILRILRRMLPITHDFHEDRFFIKKDKKLIATPLLVVLVVIETSDILFAVDSIPAILGITRDTFIVFSSNVFAILGLRALYFTLAGIMEKFHFLHYGLSGILTFIGIKMLIEHYVHISTELSLIVIAFLLAISIVASLIFPAKQQSEEPGGHNAG